MVLTPADAADKLGYARIVRRLAQLAAGPLGRERLAATAPLASRARVEALLAQTAELQELLRTDDPLPINPLPDVRQALRRAQPKDAVLDGEQLAEVAAMLGTWRRLAGYFRSRRERYPGAARLATELEPPADLLQHIERVVDPRGEVRADASPELLRISRRIAQAQDELRAALLRALRAAAREGYAAEEQPTLRNGRAVIPVRAEAKRKVQGFVHDVSGSGQTVYIEPAAVLDLNNEVRELELERGREVRRLLQAASGHLRSRLPLVQAGLDVLAQVDELQARARLANELDALVPEINDEGMVRIVRGRNPALLLHFQEEARLARDSGEGALERQVVPLDLELSDKVRTLIVTGPNAGGKSVALKTTGLLAAMVASGLPVPAAPGTSLPLFARMFVDIGDQQSIEHDLSTFTSHLANLREMLAGADERALVLIDEAGTGTDPAEGGALAQAALQALTASGARTVATTHHGTLKAFAHEAPGVENASMQFDQETLEPTYRFQAGIPGSSYAFEIAQRVGLDEGVLHHARELVGMQKTTLEDLIATFEARTQELEARLATARDEARRAEQARRSFEGRDQSLKERRQEILDQALREAESLVAEANARIEATIREIKEAQAERAITREARERLEEFKEGVGRKHRAARRRAGQRRQPGRQEPQEPQGPIGVGDQVRIEDNGAVGEVIELGEREAVVALGQMKVRAKLSRLTRVGGPRRQRVDIRAPGPPPGGATVGPAAQRRVDVRGRRVEEVVPIVERLLDEAIAGGLGEVEILHGKGTGALRESVRSYLQARPDVAGFDDAEWNAGGAGVTVVMLQ